MLTSHSSWEEWFPPRLRGLAYLTSHIFTMVASALLWDQRSEFQTSWVIADFLEMPLLTAPNPPSPQGCHCGIFSRCQVFLVPPLMSLAVFLLQWFSPITHSFLPFPVVSFSYFFRFFVLLLRYCWWQWCLYGSPRVCAKLHYPPASSHLPNSLWYLRKPSFTLTEAPACGSMLYFFWMKGLNESAFLFPLWGSWAACCLRVHVSHPSLGWSNDIRLQLRTDMRHKKWDRDVKPLWSPLVKISVTLVLLSFDLTILRN